MATISVDRLPSGSTRTLTAGTDQISIRKTTPSATNFSKSISITNLDAGAELYVSFWASAVTATEELTVLPGNTVNIDTSRNGVFDIWVRGTTGKKYSFIIM